MWDTPFDDWQMSIEDWKYPNSGLHPNMERKGNVRQDMTSEKNWNLFSNEEQHQGYTMSFTDCERQNQGTDSLSNCFSPDSLRSENESVFYTEKRSSSSDEFKTNAYQGLLCQQMVTNTNFTPNQQCQDSNFHPCITSNTSDFLSTPIALSDKSLCDMSNLEMNLPSSTVFPSSTTDITVENSGCSFSDTSFQSLKSATSNSTSSSTLSREGWLERQHFKVQNENDNSNAIFNTNAYSSRSVATNDFSDRQQNYPELTKFRNSNAGYMFLGDHTNRTCPSLMTVHSDIFNESCSPDDSTVQSPVSIEQSPVFDSSTIASGLDELAKAMAENSETARLIETALVSQKACHSEHATFPLSNSDSMEYSCQTTVSLSSHVQNSSHSVSFDASSNEKIFQDQLHSKFVPESGTLGPPPKILTTNTNSRSPPCQMPHQSDLLIEEARIDNNVPETFNYSSTGNTPFVHVYNPNKVIYSGSNNYDEGATHQNSDGSMWMKNNSYFTMSPQVDEEPLYSPTFDMTDLSSSSSEDNHLFAESEITYSPSQDPVNKLLEELDSSMCESTSQTSLKNENFPGNQIDFGTFLSAQENKVDLFSRSRVQKRSKPSSSSADSTNKKKNEDYDGHVPPTLQTFVHQTSNTWETLKNKNKASESDTLDRDNGHLSENETCFLEKDSSVIHKKRRSKNGQTKAPTSSRNILKICGVCGDRAKSMHFGGMACDSCKAFFRRSVQGKCWKEFQCLDEKSCTISKKNRKNCQYCRFAKCRSNGMDISWVMTEAERMTLWKNRIERHKKEKKRSREDLQSIVNLTDSLETCSESSVDDPDDTGKDRSSKGAGMDNFQSIPSDTNSNELPVDRPRVSSETSSTAAQETIESLDVTNSSVQKILSNVVEGTSITTFPNDQLLSKSDVVTMNNLIALLTSVFTNNPFPASCTGDTLEALTAIFCSVCQKMGSFFQRVEDFQNVPRADQTYLLRAGISTSIYFFGAYNFDGDTMSWPRKSALKVLKVPPVSRTTVMQLAQTSETYNTLMKFYESLWRDIQDEGVLALMSLLSLFQVRENYEEVKDRLGVMTRREKYIQLLGRYLRFREGERGSRVTLPKLLSGLNEVWTIAEYHSKIDIQSCMLTPNEMISAGSSKSHSGLMDSLLTLIENLAVQPFPTHSSVLVKPPTSSTEGSSVEQEPQSSDFHHPLTNAIFGHEAPGRLLSCPVELILNGPENYSNISHSLMTSGSEKTENQSLDVQATQKECSAVTYGSEPVSNRLPWADCSSSESATSVRDSTSLTQDDIGVVCEVLEYISQSDDPEAIRSLKKRLPPSVLKALASKLNDDNGIS